LAVEKILFHCLLITRKKKEKKKKKTQIKEKTKYIILYIVEILDFPPVPYLLRKVEEILLIKI